MLKFNPQNLSNLMDNKWESVIERDLPNRPDFIKEANKITYTRVAGQFLGSFADEDDMKEYLYMIGRESRYDWEMLFQGMPKVIDARKRDEVLKIIQIHRENPLSINRFMAFFYAADLFPLKNTPYDSHYRETFKRWLQLLEQRFPNLKASKLQRFLLDMIKWSEHYFKKWVKQDPFETKMPRILWYGEAKESEAYFLYFLYLFGCDIVIFQPSGENIFEIYNIKDFPTEPLNKYVEKFPFPFEKPRRIRTTALKASEELQETIYNNDALHYPWKYREYEPHSRTLKTTYDEMFILYKEDTNMREGFQVVENRVYIPVLFGKIVGVTKDRQEYWKRIQALMQDEWTHTVNKFPVANRQKSNMQFHYRDASTDGELDVEKMLSLAIWPYKKLALPLQKGLALAIIRLIDSAVISRLPGESEESYRHYLFGQALAIPDELLTLYQRFDYAYRNPTLLIFNEQGSGTFDRETAVLMKLLNGLGFNIFLYNPSGQNDLEMFIDAQYYDTHWLDEMSFEEHLEKANKVPKSEKNPKGKLKNLIRKLLD